MSVNGVAINAQSATIKDIARLTKKFNIDSSGCWLWDGAKYENGYGEFSFQGTPRRAHRFIYELFNGAIPPGLVIDHLCREVACVNPKHLEAVTQKVNMARGDVHKTSTRHRGVNVRLRCSNNHPLVGDNLYLHPNGQRRCKTCYRAYATTFKERNK